MGNSIGCLNRSSINAVENVGQETYQRRVPRERRSFENIKFNLSSLQKQRSPSTLLREDAALNASSRDYVVADNFSTEMRHSDCAPSDFAPLACEASTSAFSPIATSVKPAALLIAAHENRLSLQNLQDEFRRAKQEQLNIEAQIEAGQSDNAAWRHLLQITEKQIDYLKAELAVDPLDTGGVSGQCRSIVRSDLSAAERRQDGLALALARRDYLIERQTSLLPGALRHLFREELCVREKIYPAHRIQAIGLQYLPQELRRAVFAKLPDIADRKAWSLVSRQFNADFHANLHHIQVSTPEELIAAVHCFAGRGIDMLTIRNESPSNDWQRAEWSTVFMLALNYLSGVKELELIGSGCFKDDDFQSLLSVFNQLETLCIMDCTHLTACPLLPKNLNCLELINCTGLTDLFPVDLCDQYPQLQTLSLGGCPELVRLTTAMTGLPKHLKNLYLYTCPSLEADAIAGLQDQCPELVGLDIFDCDELQLLAPLPAGLQHLRALDGVRLTSAGLQIALSACRDLKSLELEGCTGLTSLPAGFKKVEWLNLNHCSGLHQLGGDYPALKRLQLNDCSRLNQLPSVPPNLEKLELRGSGMQPLLGIHNQIVADLQLRDFNLVESLNIPVFASRDPLKLANPARSCVVHVDELAAQVKAGNLDGYSRFAISGPADRFKLELLCDLPVRSLDFSLCHGLGGDMLRGIASFCPKLERLRLRNCSALKELPQLPPGLRVLDLSGCVRMNLESLAARLVRYEKIIDLRTLNLSACTQLEDLPGLPNGLINLSLAGCSNLKNFKGLPPSLRGLDLQGCVALESSSFLQLLQCSALKKISLEDCSLLQQAKDFTSMKCLETIALGRHLKDFISLQRFQARGGELIF